MIGNGLPRFVCVPTGWNATRTWVCGLQREMMMGVSARWRLGLGGDLKIGKYTEEPHFLGFGNREENRVV